MTLYSDFAAQRARQMAADVAAVLGIVGFVVLGVAIHGAIIALQDVGVRLTDAGSSFQSTMAEISERLSQVPLIGSGIRAPFDEASEAGTTLQDVGLAQQRATEQLAIGTGLAVAVLPVVAILLLWLIPRIRFMRRSSWARAASTSVAGIDLLASRALATRRLPQIVAAHPDAAGGWRRNDPAAIEALALLELRACGVRPGRTAVLRGTRTPLT
jgi:hypothetical protein